MQHFHLFLSAHSPQKRYFTILLTNHHGGVHFSNVQRCHLEQHLTNQCRITRQKPLRCTVNRRPQDDQTRYRCSFCRSAHRSILRRTKQGGDRTIPVRDDPQFTLRHIGDQRMTRQHAAFYRQGDGLIARGAWVLSILHQMPGQQGNGLAPIALQQGHGPGRVNRGQTTVVWL